MCLSLLVVPVLEMSLYLNCAKIDLCFISSGIQFLAQMFYPQGCDRTPRILDRWGKFFIAWMRCGPNQSVPIVTPKIMTVNTCINFISGHLMEHYALFFLQFCYYKQTSKRDLIFSVLCTCQNSFFQKDKSQSLQLRCPHGLAGVWGVTSLPRMALSVPLFLLPREPPAWDRADSCSLGKWLMASLISRKTALLWISCSYLSFKKNNLYIYFWHVVGSI